VENQLQLDPIPRLAFQLGTNPDNRRTLDFDLDDNDGLSSRLSTLIGNGVIDLDDDDGIYVIPSEPPGLSYRVSIPSEPSRLDSRLTSSIDDSHVLAFSASMPIMESMSSLTIRFQSSLLASALSSHLLMAI
jgi:hypothetical protein